ncbi:MAG: hypothetical protein QW045_02225 [Candidatus Micrarchaeaceae archaeon]
MGGYKPCRKAYNFYLILRFINMVVMKTAYKDRAYPSKEQR